MTNQIYNANKAVRDNFLAAKWQAELERMDEAQKKLDLYKDDYKEIILDVLRNSFHADNYKRLYPHVNQSQNVMKRVINQTSIIYKTEPVRSLSVTSDRYTDILEDNKLKINTKSKKINRYTNLLNEVIVKVGIRENRIVYDLITPNVCFVIQKPEDPTQAYAIIYMTSSVNTAGSDEIIYHYWDIDGSYWKMDKDFRVFEIVYDADDPATFGVSPYIDPETNYFIMPFIVCRRQEPDGAFWDQDTGRDLYNAAITIGWKMTLFDYHFKIGTIKQPYIIGDDVKVPDKQVLDPSTLLSGSGEGAQIGILDMQLNLDGQKNALVYAVNSIINNYGISADQWSLNIQEMSGRALKIRSQALLETRQDQLPFYREFEHEWFKVTRIVNNAHFSKKIPDNAEFSVDFGEIDFPDDPEDELRLDAKYLKIGLISLGQFFMKYNPDIKDEKEAEKKALENIAKLEKILSKSQPLDEAIDMILDQFYDPDQSGGRREEPE